VPLLPLVVLVCAQATDPAPPAAAPSFEALVETRAGEALRAWCADHRWERFARVKSLAARWLEARGALDPDSERRAREALGFAAPWCEAAEPGGGFASRVLAWGEAELGRYVTLRAEVEALAERAAGSSVGADWNRLRERAGPVELAFLVKPLVQVARSAWQNGREDEALAIERVLLEVAETWQDGPWLAWHAEWLAQSDWTHGRLAEAAAGLRRASAIRGDMGQREAVAAFQCDLTAIELSRGELELALVSATEATAIASDLGVRDLARRAAHARASCHYELGELEPALAVLAENERAGRSYDLIQYRLDLLHGGVLADVGRLEAARSWSERAMALARSERVAAEAPHACGEAWLQLGLVLGDLGETEPALALLEQARSFYQERGDPRGVAWAEKNRGWVLLRAHEPREAHEAFERALAHAAANSLPFLEGWCALGMAESAAAASGAEEEIERGLATAERCSARLHDLHLAARVASLRGARLAAAGEKEGALAAFAQAVVAFERLRARFSEPGLLTHFLRDKLDPYQRSACLAAELGRSGEALRLAELARARALFELRRRREEGEAGPLDSRVSSARRMLAGTEARLRAADDPVERERMAGLMREHEEDLESALLESELASPRRTRLALGARPELDLARLRAGLERGAFDCAVEYVLGDEQSWAILVRSEGDELALESVCLPLGRSGVEALVRRLRAPLDLLERGEIDLLHLDFDVAAARELHDALLAPLGARLGARVAVVPDGCLAGVPFDALVARDERGTSGREERPFARLRGLRFALEERAFAFLPSMAALASEPRAASASGATLLVAAQDARPPSAVRELETIADAARERFGVLRVLQGARAEDAALALRSSRMVHVAAHGIVDPDFPATSHLLFASEGEGARLEAWRIEALPIAAELVVLSACHGGEGLLASGEGVQSLARSFLAAGACEVVASLWAVEDRASAALMRCFYVELARGAPALDALRSAKLALAASDDPRGFAYAHPHFWAAWFATVAR